MSTVRCCSMLCQLHLEPSVLVLSGRGADDFNVLEPQTDLSQTVVSMKPRQLGPVKLNRLIWVVSRRQTLWLHCNPRSDSLGNLWQSDTCTQTLESVCFNDEKSSVLCHSLLPIFYNVIQVNFFSMCLDFISFQNPANVLTIWL